MSKGELRAHSLWFFAALIGPNLLGQMQTGAVIATPGSTQGDASQTTPSGTPELTISPQRGDASFTGSVPQGQASGTAIALGLNDAVERGLKANLGLLTSEEASREARAQRIRALSTLLPRVNGQI